VQLNIVEAFLVIYSLRALIHTVTHTGPPPPPARDSVSNWYALHKLA
jgi:hypothetical protein